MRGEVPLRGELDPTPDDYAAAYPKRSLEQIIWLVVHHTGKSLARPSLQTVAEFQIGPDAQAPFPGFAYTGYVDGDGTISVVWDIETVTWSQGDNSPSKIDGVGIFNYQGIAFCFAGRDPTPAQITSYKTIKRGSQTVLGRSLIVRGHRDVTGISDSNCPGDAMEARLQEIQNA